jgi:lipoprotein-anchoring transpeptidase ErfK/SrfK
MAACGGGGSAETSHHDTTQASASTPPAPPVRLAISPAGGRRDSAPGRGIVVRATGGKISSVVVADGSDHVTGTLNAAGTVWHSRWPLAVAHHYTVTAAAVGSSGKPGMKRSSFSTLTPHHTIETRIIEGYHQTYGVGMPIILYFSGPVAHKAAVEHALEIKSSKRVLGAWYWDSPCNMAPACLYFRPRHYWPAHTRVSFTGHLDGVEVAPGVFGHHTLTQSFMIGSKLTVSVSTAHHDMHVYRDGKLFAHWPISSGRPGDDTPSGTYLTIQKANPVEMKGPGYDISVPFSVRFTWSGDYLHDAYWSVGEQGFSNVSHGCVNMSPANAETFYNMAVPGDPVTITGSPRASTWGNGWTMWFLRWRQWLRGSALHKAVRVGPHGSRLVRPRA